MSCGPEGIQSSRTNSTKTQLVQLGEHVLWWVLGPSKRNETQPRCSRSLSWLMQVHMGVVWP